MPRGAKSRMRRTETPTPIWIKFCMVVDIADVVMHTNFGDHPLRGLWGACASLSLQHARTNVRACDNALPSHRLRPHIARHAAVYRPTRRRPLYHPRRDTIGIKGITHNETQSSPLYPSQHNATGLQL